MKFVQLYLEQTRYVMMYRHCDGKLVLKVTDDRQVLVHFSKTKQIYIQCILIFEGQSYVHV